MHAVKLEHTHMAINSSYNAYLQYRHTTQFQKQEYLDNLFNDMTANIDDYADIIREETGKPLKEAIGEVNYSLSYFKYYASEAIRINGDLISSPFPNQEIKVTRHPVGVAAIITPWNFPLAMVVRKVAAALASGCAVIIKPAVETVKTACRLGQSALDTKLPPGLINVIPIKSDELKEHVHLLTSDKQIAKLSITGSTRAGISLYQESAKHMKRVSMELGGNASCIIFKDADLSKVIASLKVGKLRNTGQTCVSVNRIFVHSSIKQQFVAQLVKMLENAKVHEDFGPLINEKALNKTKDIVATAKEQGAYILYTKEFQAPNALFYPPTILDNIKPGMDIYHTEVFSPLFSIVTFESTEDVIDLANEEPYGLSNYVFSNDMATIHKCRNEIETGMIGLNTCSISQAGVPFGGIKMSGFGREGGAYGIEEYTYLKYSNQQF